MAFGISNFEQLPWYIQVALEDMEVRIQALLRNVQTDILASASSTASATAASEGRHWKAVAPWLMDDPASATPNVVGLVPPTLLATTINNYAPQGIDDAVMLELESSVGDVTITGIKPRPGGVKRLMMIRNRDSQRTITLAHANSGSLATAQFDLPSSVAVALGPKQNAWMYYDPNRDGGKWTMFVTPNQSGGISSTTVGGGLLVTEFSLTEAQLEAMTSAAGVEVVAAPGAGYKFYIVAFTVQSVIATGYSNAPSYVMEITGGAVTSTTSGAPGLNATGTTHVSGAPNADSFSETTFNPENLGITIRLSAALTGSGSATAKGAVAYYKYAIA